MWPMEKPMRVSRKAERVARLSGTLRSAGGVSADPTPAEAGGSLRQEAVA